MDSPPLNVEQDDDDRISALPDHLLVGILERIDLRTAIRAGAVSTRWRHVPHQLSRLSLKAGHFQGGGAAAPQEIMRAYTGALWRLLSVFPPPACRQRNCSRAIGTLRLSFYVSGTPQLHSIGRAVEHVVSRGETETLKFRVLPPPNVPVLAEFGQQFMSFSRAYPVAFRWVTTISLNNLMFGDSAVADLVRACDRLRRLCMRSCNLVDLHAVLRIDAPGSQLEKLEFTGFRSRKIELVSLPKLRKVRCHHWHHMNPPLCFGYVPELRVVSLASHANMWQAPFTLSECFSRSAVTNLSIMHLDFNYQMIWIEPENPMDLTSIFRNLMEVQLTRIFPECDLSWTLFILEAAPSLQNFALSRNQHSCVKTSEHSAEKTNVVWEPSKDFKHFNLKLLVMQGFEDEDKVTNFVKLVMERAKGLQRIKLRGKHHPCKECNDDLDLDSARRYQVDQDKRHRIKDRLIHGSSSSVEIIIC
ncbi:unnamed protein product [Alopecurus aequalis]